jgi:hypothetical protein
MLDGKQAVLDGEIVCLDERGRSERRCRFRLHDRASSRYELSLPLAS